MPWERDVDVRVKSQQDNPDVGEKLIRPPLATRDGAIFTADWYHKQLLRGKIFQVAGGATNQGITDPGTFGAGAIDTDEFDFFATIPEGTIIIPLEYTIVMEAFGATGLLEILLATGTAAVSGGSGVTLTPVNQNGSSNNASALTGKVSINNADGGTALTKETEIWRDGLQLVEDITANDDAAWPSRFQWKAEGPGDLHIIQGEKFLCGWIAAVGGTGFQKFVYAEFETGEDIG